MDDKSEVGDIVLRKEADCICGVQLLFQGIGKFFVQQGEAKVVQFVICYSRIRSTVK